MAITEAALTSSSKNDGGGSFTTAATASVTPGANQLVLVDVFHNASVAANAANPTSVVGAGLTFTRVDSVIDTAAGSTLSRWRALSASPSTGAITVTFPSATTAAVWSVHQYAGVDTGGTNGANAIVQTVHNSNGAGTVATIAATLAAFGSVNNGASSCHGWFNAAAVQTATPRAGWTEIHDLGTTYSGGVLADCLETQWRASNDTTAQATWTANGAVYAIASELKASANVTITPPAGTLALAGQVPTVLVSANQTIAVPASALTLTGNIPTVLTPVTVPVPAASLSLTGLVPSVLVAANQIIAMPAAALTLTGLTPVVAVTANQTVSVPVGSLSLTALAPAIAISNHQIVAAPAGALSLTAFVPSVLIGGSVVVDVPVAQLTLAAAPPDVISSGGVSISGFFIVRARRRGSR